MIERFVRYQVRRDSLDAAVKLVASFVDEVGRKEGGTAFYKVWREVEDPTRFVHHMGFRTPSAEDYHKKTAWAKAFHAKLQPLCTSAPAQVDVEIVATTL